MRDFRGIDETQERTARQMARDTRPLDVGFKTKSLDMVVSDGV